MMTVIVQRDTGVRRCGPSRFVHQRRRDFNDSIDLSGGSSLYLAGVQFAPSDNAELSGNTDTDGYVGQVWAWTLTYSGNSKIIQEGLQAEKPGILRLDAACTAPGTPCIP